MQTLEKSIERTAEILALDPEELQLWLEQYPNLTPYTQIQLLRMAARYQLDPISDELGIMETHEGHQAFITIDGWVKLINTHEQYAGMSLREATTEDKNQAPEWMECTIYRHDRILPIVLKEYLEEVRTEHPSWLQMPRRMLRHRVIQQCARVAFGISQRDLLIKTSNVEINSSHQKIHLGIGEIELLKNQQTQNLKTILRKQSGI